MHGNKKLQETVVARKALCGGGRLGTMKLDSFLQCRHQDLHNHSLLVYDIACMWTIAALTELTGGFAGCRNWCACQTSICLHTRMDPQSSGGSQLRFTALECALALHTLAELHGLLTHCALAELQNPVDTVAVTMVQMLLLAPLMRLARNGTTFSLQFKPILFIT